MFQSIMKKFTKWIDPKLEKYRPKKEGYSPKSEKDLVGVLRRTPKDVLGDRERNLIAAAMNFSYCKVSEIMLPKPEITFVYEKDTLGPLMLDKLYRSGFSHFPVLDTKNKIIGVIHTETFNSLEVKDTDKIKKYLDPKVYYLRSDYNLEQALAAFLRTNSFFFLVIDREEEIVGLVTYKMLVSHLLGGEPEDDFDQDDSTYAVARR